MKAFTSVSVADRVIKATRALAPVIVVIAMFFAALPAEAVPKLGSARPAIKLVDGWDRVNDLSLGSRPLLVVYEDKDSSKQNQKLKDDLAALEKSIHYRKWVEHIVVADVSAYDYWPARDIAKGELQKWTKKIGFVIYSDFTGSVRTSLGFEKGKSNVVLYSRDSKVLFSKAGTVPELDRHRLVDLVSNLVTSKTDS